MARKPVKKGCPPEHCALSELRILLFLERCKTAFAQINSRQFVAFTQAAYAFDGLPLKSAAEKMGKQAEMRWKLRAAADKRALRILSDFKSMNPRWLLQFPYAALIMIVYYCHSCMYFRKKSRELGGSCGWKKRSMRIPPEITARTPVGGCFAARKKQERKRGKWKEERCVGAGCCA